MSQQSLAAGHWLADGLKWTGDGTGLAPAGVSEGEESWTWRGEPLDSPGALFASTGWRGPRTSNGLTALNSSRHQGMYFVEKNVARVN